MAGSSPEEVVRAYLEAQARLEPTVHFAMGRLRTTSTVIDEINAGGETEQAAVNVRSLSVRENDDGRAAVDLDAFIVHHGKSRHGVFTSDYRFRGPLELRRVAGDWKISSAVIDGVSLPDAVYEPLVERDLAGCQLTLFAQPTKKGTLLAARVVNTTDRPVVVSELEMTVPYLRMLTLRWGALDVPATIEPGESWAGVTSWTPLRLGSSVGARIAVGGEEAIVALSPPAARSWSRRAKLRRFNGTSAFVGVLLILGLVNAIATSWRGLGFLGLALAIGGSLLASRGALVELAGFRSSGSVSMAIVGLAATVAGSAIMLRSGFGWIGVLVLVATIVFTMQSAFARANYMRRRRSRQIETAEARAT